MVTEIILVRKLRKMGRQPSCFIAGTQVAMAGQESPTIAAASTDAVSQGEADPRPLGAVALAMLAGTALVDDWRSRRKRKRKDKTDSERTDTMLADNDPWPVEPELDDETLAAIGGAWSAGQAETDRLTAATGEEYSEPIQESSPMVSEDDKSIALAEGSRCEVSPTAGNRRRPLRWIAAGLCLLAAMLFWHSADRPVTTASLAPVRASTAPFATAQPLTPTKNIESKMSPGMSPKAN